MLFRSRLQPLSSNQNMFKKKGDTPSILTDELFVSPCMLDRLPELLEARVGFGELWDKHYNQI